MSVDEGVGCCLAELLEQAAKAFNIRAQNMDTKLLRLALFLDPRFMKSAFTEATYNGLLITVCMSACTSRALCMPLQHSSWLRACIHSAAFAF